jgi:hypothetical protein
MWYGTCQLMYSACQSFTVKVLSNELAVFDHWLTPGVVWDSATTMVVGELQLPPISSRSQPCTCSLLWPLQDNGNYSTVETFLADFSTYSTAYYFYCELVLNFSSNFWFYQIFFSSRRLRNNFFLNTWTWILV